MTEDQEIDKVRTPREVAERALALFAIVGLGFGTDRQSALEWLADNNLNEALSPSERILIEAEQPTPKQLVNASWQSECLIVLLWALDLIGSLPAADEQCDSRIFQAFLPPYAEISVADFIAAARLLPDSVLVAMSDEILDLHWHARDAQIHSRAPVRPVDIEIIQERHHAINWIIGYDGLAWDEVTTDT
ncbi:MAG: DUF4272 domain-containing protein [Sphingorhabdus sp.]